ncbi:hypothetical protein ABID65_009105 [Bradyrhizobium sp. S3.9.2]|uniref:hypothetical protein n=1 Tax=unclassified Bradyrhizobium TaxID=2631580 RepID=UPI003391246A
MLRADLYAVAALVAAVIVVIGHMLQLPVPAVTTVALLSCFSDDGFWRPDVRMPFQIGEGETVLMHYTGLVQQTDTFKQAAEANQPTEGPVYAPDDAF